MGTRVLGAITIAVALSLWTSACAKKEPKHKTLADCATAATAARDDAKSARAAKHPKKAATAAARAKSLADHAETLAPSSATTADSQSLLQIRGAAREAQRHASLAADDDKYAGLTTSWRAKAYRGARSASLPALYKTLAAAARQMNQAQAATQPGLLRDSANLAREIAVAIDPTLVSAEGAVNWLGVATVLDGLSASEPAGLHVGLAASLLLSGNTTLALAEIELASPSSATTPDEKLILEIARAVVLSSNGCSDLAIEKLEASLPTTTRPTTDSGANSLEAAEMVGIIHLLIAADATQKGDYVIADSHVARSLRAWPNNPLAVAITGQRLAADGRWEEAANSLEAAAEGSEHEWLAQALAQRARDIRDGKDRSQGLLADGAFLRQMLLKHLMRESGKTVRRWAKPAEDLANKLLAVLPANLRGNSPATTPSYSQ